MEFRNEEFLQRKRFAQILRYIANMHQSLNSSEDGVSFVQQIHDRSQDVPNFFHDAERRERENGVLFTTDNFRDLLAMDEEDESGSVFESPLFNFYAASSGASSKNGLKKRTLAGGLKDALVRKKNDEKISSCWLRLTRKSQLPSPPTENDAEVRRYLDEWLSQTPGVRSVEQLLTKRRIARAPKIPPSVGTKGGRRIQSFLTKYKIFLGKLSYQKQLEPMYNRLFEWMQDHNDELVWGLGHARILLGDGTLVNGPLLEVLVEVELARDGALLVRPRNHTGVTLNREVSTALVSAAKSAAGSSDVLSNFHKTIAELESSEISPGQPSTYVPLLKRIAMEMSSDGSFQPSSSTRRDAKKLLVTEAWCLYSRPKASSVWARDANAFADQLIAAPKDSTQMLSKATWAFTHGPAELDESDKKDPQNNSHINLRWLRDWFGKQMLPKKNEPVKSIFKPVFALPVSVAQHRIADLLLARNYPAVVCEGPPGTGKSHTIANMICAYLCQGKRVLVTSKNSPALSVLRHRLPSSVQDLCVDVSMSESEGMRNLQKTVERLAMRIAAVNSEVERQKHSYLMDLILELEQDVEEIDAKLSNNSERIRQIVKTSEGQQLVNLSTSLVVEAPWLMHKLSSLSFDAIKKLKKRTEDLVEEDDQALKEVSGYILPITDALVSYVAFKAGSSYSAITNTAKAALANIPLLGSMSGAKHRKEEVEKAAAKLMLNGNTPQLKSEWEVVLRALRRVQNLKRFDNEIWSVYHRNDGWPQRDFLTNTGELRRFYDLMVKAVTLKQLAEDLAIEEHFGLAAESRTLDARRSALTSKLQNLAEELVDATVVAKLSQSFSADAQSALIRFAQLAGRQKFSQASQLSKMTQRQRRKRQDYLEAFDKCCRFIPCWIMTTSQISDYLPAECLFDLVIIDESSQSDITALPGLLRGRQWLIVGDGKQVSPTESFVSEDKMESLRASLPSTPFASSLLPGQSFFDLSAQLFPKGRVVLNEHFRCAAEIIKFSNENFYNGELIPMRLPTKSERIRPSIVDVRVPNGRKVGKSNRGEATAIIDHVSEIVMNSSESNLRSIGVISLMGAEQSQIIRSGLLERIGPEKMAKHEVLVGEPPNFQGAERDIIVLSMVCSKGCSPTQNQLMHFQRANVAMSRARDQLILFRSLDIQDVPSAEDMKIPIFEFFQAATSDDDDDDKKDVGVEEGNPKIKNLTKTLLESLLRKRGFIVESMGVVWKNAVTVEHPSSDARVALLVECAEDSVHEWSSAYKQQKAIERVGWKCLRVDVLSLLVGLDETLKMIIEFLASNGIQQSVALALDKMLDDDSIESEVSDHNVNVDISGIRDRENMQKGDPGQEKQDEHENPNDDASSAAPDIIPRAENRNTAVISSDEEEDMKPRKKKRKISPEDHFETGDETMEASNFGDTVELDFLLPRPDEANHAIGVRPETGSVGETAYQAGSSTWSDGEQDRRSVGSESQEESRVAKSLTSLSRANSERSDNGSRKAQNVDKKQRAREEPGIPRRRSSRSSRRKRLKRSSFHSDDDEDCSRRDNETEKDATVQPASEDQYDLLDRTTTRRKRITSSSFHDVDDDDDDDENCSKKDDTAEEDASVQPPSDHTDESSSRSSGDDRSKRSRRSYRRLDKYQRDGRWYPKRNASKDEDDEFSYDSDGDIKLDKDGKRKISQKSKQDETACSADARSVNSQTSKLSRRYYRGVVNYERDGHWHPKNDLKDGEEDEYSYDTDGDLRHDADEEVKNVDSIGDKRESLDAEDTKLGRGQMESAGKLGENSAQDIASRTLQVSRSASSESDSIVDATLQSSKQGTCADTHTSDIPESVRHEGQTISSQNRRNLKR